MSLPRLLPTAYCLLNLRQPDSAFERIEILESYHDNHGHYHSGSAYGDSDLRACAQALTLSLSGRRYNLSSILLPVLS